MTDINGQPNIIGDGINVAQRVMSFAQLNQALISRSYFEVVSRLSEEYGQLFHYEGSPTAKHVREHEVYALGYPSVPRPRPSAPAGTSDSGPRSAGSRATRPGLATGSRSNGALALPWWKARKLWIALAVAVAVALALGSFIRGLKKAAEQKRGSESIAAVQSVPPRQAKAEAPKPVTAQPERPKPALAPRVQEAAREGKLARSEGTAELSPNQTAFVALAIAPWGEVYVDGKLQGVSPPLRFVQVTPGKHRIEIRNSSFPPYSETITAKPGEKIRIKHKF